MGDDVQTKRDKDANKHESRSGILAALKSLVFREVSSEKVQGMQRAASCNGLKEAGERSSKRILTMHRGAIVSCLIFPTGVFFVMAPTPLRAQTYTESVLYAFPGTYPMGVDCGYSSPA